MKKLTSKKRGFTIVELVIVIAVIAILAAVLIPTFANVVQSAKIAAAKSDVKNVYSSFVADCAIDGKEYSAMGEYVFYKIADSKCYTWNGVENTVTETTLPAGYSLNESTLTTRAAVAAVYSEVIATAPDDWATKYNTYYVRTGEATNYTYELNEEATFASAGSICSLTTPEAEAVTETLKEYNGYYIFK